MTQASPRPAATGWPQGTLLGELSSTARTKLLNLGYATHYAQGALLFGQGDQTTDGVLITSGVVKLMTHDDQGYDLLLDIQAGGTSVGLIEALDGGPRTTTAMAATPVDALRIDRMALQHLLARNPDLALAISQDFARQLRSAHRRRRDLAGSSTVRQRVARVLGELSESFGQRTLYGVTITVSLSQQELASLVGASQLTLHKALASLRREGVIETGYRRVIIRDPDALAEVAEGRPT
jgi:CRP-like cAMP-binding protein